MRTVLIYDDGLIVLRVEDGESVVLAQAEVDGEYSYYSREQVHALLSESLLFGDLTSAQQDTLLAASARLKRIIKSAHKCILDDSFRLDIALVESEQDDQFTEEEMTRLPKITEDDHGWFTVEGDERMFKPQHTHGDSWDVWARPLGVDDGHLFTTVNASNLELAVKKAALLLLAD